jgi:tetratricopeptide (TPR) repeat protein
MYQRCLEIFEQIGYRLGVAGLYNNLGSLAQDRGDYRQARVMFQRSLEIRQEIGNRHGVAMSLTNLGLVYLESGDEARAYQQLKESLALQRELGLGDFESITCSYMAQACAHLGRFEEAVEMADEAVSLAVGSGQRGNEGLARRVWGQVRRQMAALEHGNKREKLLAHAGLELERSLKIFLELGMEQERGRTLLEISRLHIESGRFQQAREVIQQSRDIFAKLDAQGDLRQAEEVLTSLLEES